MCFLWYSGVVIFCFSSSKSHLMAGHVEERSLMNVFFLAFVEKHKSWVFFSFDIKLLSTWPHKSCTQVSIFFLLRLHGWRQQYNSTNLVLISKFKAKFMCVDNQYDSFLCSPPMNDWRYIESFNMIQSSILRENKKEK